MELNANFDDRVVVHSKEMPWKTSPMAGVDRRMLDRLGGEVARATTIVRYAPGSYFSPHVHTGGEEFLVLEGVFQDEHGDFPAGSYIRNPPQSSHTPRSEPGCVIFVKLGQFDTADRTQIRIDTNHKAFAADDQRSGVETMLLFADDHEEVSLERWEANATINLEAERSIEVLVLEGSFEESRDQLKEQSWLRLPNGSTSSAQTGPTGAKVWIKRNHLMEAPTAPKV